MSLPNKTGKSIRPPTFLKFSNERYKNGNRVTKPFIVLLGILSWPV